MFLDFAMIHGQNITLTACNYSTPYPIQGSTGYYLYDGINLTINTYFEHTAVTLISVQITSTRDTSFFFQAFFGRSVASCLESWQNRCTHTFDPDSSCDSCDYSVTLSSYDSSLDDMAYVTGVATTIASPACVVALTGSTFFLYHARFLN